MAHLECRSPSTPGLSLSHYLYDELYCCYRNIISSIGFEKPKLAYEFMKSFTHFKISWVNSVTKSNLQFRSRKGVVRCVSLWKWVWCLWDLIIQEVGLKKKKIRKCNLTAICKHSWEKTHVQKIREILNPKFLLTFSSIYHCHWHSEVNIELSH